MDAIAQRPAQYPINSSNARELQRKSAESRLANKKAAKIQEQAIKDAEQRRLITLLPFQQTPLQSKVVMQIEQIDNMMEDCRAVELPRLAQAKAQLWALLFPKPRQSRSGRTQPLSVEPQIPQV